MTYLAHSARNGCPAQDYKDHVQRTTKAAVSLAREVGAYTRSDGAEILMVTEDRSASRHDMGKLNVKNQEILHSGSRENLRVAHEDAGAAYFLQQEHWDPTSAVVISAHHRGYTFFLEGKQEEGRPRFRNPNVYADVDKELPLLIKIHHSLGFPDFPALPDFDIPGDYSVFYRMLLSILADADHTDTARHYQNYPEHDEEPALRAEERLRQLDQYVEQLGQKKDERNRLRREMYEACRNGEPRGDISSCDSPVGSGKTTAVMAHLLRQAQRRGLRRIFVILPFTNIISQSVKIYREALALPGEDPERVVAEMHHRADFQEADTRYLTALWKAPIVVTTAVAFFETLASNHPATLRRFHQLPGSAIFVDEAHAILPLYLMPLAWKWMNVFAEEWSCYWVLASGSLNRFWNIKEMSAGIHRDVEEIIRSELRKELAQYEAGRVTFHWDPQPKTRKELVDRVMKKPGPRLIIMNTVQSTAAVAQWAAETYGREKVEHLSTALTAADREQTIKKIYERLNDPNDNDWVLVATSCVEAGLNFSFHTGFRELASLLSSLQAAGRVGRNGEYDDAEMWIFCMQEDGVIQRNPGVQQSAAILQKYLEEGKILSPALSTKAIEAEIRTYGMDTSEKNPDTLLNKEDMQDFPYVNKNFRVIDTNPVVAVANEELIVALQKGKSNWRQIQRYSFQISQGKIAYLKSRELELPKLCPGIYEWNLEYDSFLGYMKGMLGQLKS